MALIKLHGTSGAGKTTAVRELMALAYDITPIGKPSRPEAYRLRFHDMPSPIFVLGSYEATCGGMDSITSVDEQIRLIHTYAEVGHVVYEGLLMSTYYGRLGAAVERYGSDHIWAFMDTPIETCIERVKRRRLEAGNTKPLNEDNTRARTKSIASLRNKLRHKVATIVDIRHDQPAGEQLLNLLEQCK